MGETTMKTVWTPVLILSLALTVAAKASPQETARRPLSQRHHGVATIIGAAARSPAS